MRRDASVQNCRCFSQVVSSRSRRTLAVNGADAEGPIGRVRIPGTKKETGRFRGVHRRPLNHVQSAIFTYFFLPLLVLISGIRRVSLTVRLVTFRADRLRYFFPQHDGVRFAVLRFYWPRDGMVAMNLSRFANLLTASNEPPAPRRKHLLVKGREKEKKRACQCGYRLPFSFSRILRTTVN